MLRVKRHKIWIALPWFEEVGEVSVGIRQRIVEGIRDGAFAAAGVFKSLMLPYAPRSILCQYEGGSHR